VTAPMVHPSGDFSRNFGPLLVSSSRRSRCNCQLNKTTKRAHAVQSAKNYPLHGNEPAETMVEKSPKPGPIEH